MLNTWVSAHSVDVRQTDLSSTEPVHFMSPTQLQALNNGLKSMFCYRIMVLFVLNDPKDSDFKRTAPRVLQRTLVSAHLRPYCFRPLWHHLHLRKLFVYLKLRL